MFSPDGRYLFSGSNDYDVKLWDVSTGRLIRTFRGHKGAIETMALSPDGRILATGSYDEKAKLLDVETGRLLWSSPSHNDLFFSPDGQRLITMTEREIRMWDAARGSLIGKMSSVFWQSFFSPDWRHFVTVGKKKDTIELYDFFD